MQMKKIVIYRQAPAPVLAGCYAQRGRLGECWCRWRAVPEAHGRRWSTSRFEGQTTHQELGVRGHELQRHPQRTKHLPI